MSLEEAAKSKMMFGKYEGCTLDELSKTRPGHGYLKWVLKAQAGNRKIRKAIDLVLKVNPMPPAMTLEEARARVIPFGPRKGSTMGSAPTSCLEDFMLMSDKYADLRGAAKLVQENRGQKIVPLTRYDAEKAQVPNFRFLAKYKGMKLSETPKRVLERLLKWKNVQPSMKELCEILQRTPPEKTSLSARRQSLLFPLATRP